MMATPLAVPLVSGIAWAGADYDVNYDAGSIPWSRWQGEETERDMMLLEERDRQDDSDDNEGWMVAPPQDKDDDE
ncbi:MAG: hypothetical protein GDA50_07025 [Alphaproteobacteria bacterium GM202ARS2]|nr:hypothetical protein [Alphaproteobacteria bacterium GM202ARS2]